MPYNKVKNCIICNKEFIARNWRAEICSHVCHLKRRIAWHKDNGDKVRARAKYTYHHGRKSYYRKYEKTLNGFLMRMYRNMKSRVLGIQKKKAHLYKNKELLSKESFYEFAKNSKEFKKLYKTWISKNYDRKLTPTIDRINPQYGYSIPNMEWVTHSENSRRSSITRKMKI